MLKKLEGFMIKLRNIKIEGNIALCDVIPEQSAEIGFLKVDLERKKIIECQIPEKYKNHPFDYAGKAADGLFKACEKRENVPKEKLVMWY